MSLREQTLEPITRDQIKAYAEASGDPNPIHLDDDYAKKMGLPSVIAHGMLTMGLVARVIEDWGFPPNTWTTYSSKFKDKVLPGDTLTVQLLEKEENQLKLTVIKGDGAEVLSAEVHLQ